MTRVKQGSRPEESETVDFALAEVADLYDRHENLVWSYPHHSLTFGGSAHSFVIDQSPVQEVKHVWTGAAGFSRSPASPGAPALAPRGPVVSQGDHAMGTDVARATYKVDGAGIKVGVISDSFNLDGGLAGERADGELPNATTILKEGEWGIDEGRAMAQIVHDVAPGASILFATGGPSIETMAQSIRDLAAAGARVIVDDLYYQAEPTYQDGAVSQAISEVTAKGVTYVTLAGNNGNRAYGAPFKGAPSSTVIEGQSVLLHEFAPGKDSIAITIPPNTNIPFALQWSDAYSSISPGKGAKSDLDLLFYDDRDQLLFKVSNPNIGGDPVEQISYLTGDAAETIHVKVGLAGGPMPDEFRLISLGNTLPVYFETVASNVNPGTIYGHSAAKDAITVGAVDYRDTPAYGASQPWSEGFSSVGAVPFTYDVHGDKLPSADVRNALAFMAPDSGDNTFFGYDRDGNGLPNFFGTSAAAPHAAALAALMLQANPALTGSDIKSLLQDGAIDMDDLNTRGFDKGYDSGTGAGLVQATALGFAVTGVIDNPLHKSLLLGTHLDDRIVGWDGDGAGGKGAAYDVTLHGYAGNDRLEGGTGNDTLDGGAGFDTMFGRGGNDRYVVDSAADTVVEDADGGTDTVLASVSYALGANVENLTLSGKEAISAFGNSRDNVLIGNAAANMIVGNGGDDRIDGGDGDDTLIGGDGADRIVGGGGNDMIHANGGANRIDAGAGNDLITAGDGDDLIVGGTGNDTIHANGGRNMLQLGGISGATSDGDDRIWTGNGADTYTLFFHDAAGGKAGFGNDTINGFRLAEGDRLLAFDDKVGYWDDPCTLSALAREGAVKGMRSADGGDLTLTFAREHDSPSSLTLKWFFWDNGGFLSDGARDTRFGGSVLASDLTGILARTVHDAHAGGITGPEHFAAIHHPAADGYDFV